MIDEILTRGVDEVIDKKNLEEKLASGKKLRIKLGIDPTSPNLHLGRAIPLLKLRDFQNAGHKIILIIGDFTGVIGDTSDKESERPMLGEKIIKQNMKTYIKQAGKILDIKKCEVRHNSEWLKKLDYHEIGRQAENFSLNEFISRENIKKRLDDGKRISLRELMYPLMQGYDSVAIKAGVEIGGTDQRFNLLAGRQLQRFYKQEPQDIITNPLIEGLDGRKMSSSWGNTVNLLDSADEMFGKIMSLKDEFIIKYFTLVTRVRLQEIEEIKKIPNPRDQKAILAKEIVKMYHGEKLAERAEKEFNKIFRNKELPSDMPVLEIPAGKYNIIDLLCLPAGRQATPLVPSKNEAKRLVEQKAVEILNGENKTKITDWKAEINLENGTIIKVGGRRFMKLKLK
ncbi:MAG: tyrosine--tRNA ligase [Candidatus Staskawiczbacteria bacterium RIFOXYD2_FULL_37_9]|uniref:Tyrosine--tRNA ligase n=1 Tax=Candidatus Staskawiczbacteria bacterium RIFOXYB1_FULL_37_44 TaxID=1802223 RepID=A0A1G2IYG6_9BACT|nr:MAG: tyrosine--tRNA ligase [Candidatus Staskawiczbacteria bacterium RIFOXYB1_FULL_37_44]OGZ83704.1 MAG: tyrosine--tRNA ligase [Candidatus Staskawiczbacteria bacterium RIFOXYC1_FULL_37_52]OGZ87213.1 MAG: tyrosine--tRNA ligase [Candidatus Staskawiczbacteria bacterium RIFOXYC2_FULL_37_19]OGZ90228.1 MAG: tyrosine--tRNA ligase [Candidatus Staskawiczbacteria bacterium RIFOXYD1_FULL_37_110]OGZ93358.1 MAG: tyrosine--tRNA ligase [Candidatus Staskawiczbacteria bacterium RIFOXYD2_FULL_37_9]